MSRLLRSNQIEIVIKITKHCNLRCTYCYEFPYLAQKNVISLLNLERLFANLSTFEPSPASKNQGSFYQNDLSFIWHGGEPFMVPLDYYEEIGSIQRQTIGRKLSYENAVQTNLTIMTDAHIQFLNEHYFFHSLGFSFDVYGDARVDTANKSTAEKVIKNLQKLRDRSIPTGGIAVLSQSTFPYIENIYRFYESLDCSFRILPYHIEKSTEQTLVNGLTPQEIISAMCMVFDLWMQSENPIRVAPIETYIASALAYLGKTNRGYYEKIVDESVFVVDINGDVTGYETYQHDHVYGNLFVEPFVEILNSAARARAAQKSAERVEKYCSKCTYFGACMGQPVAEANPFEEQWLAMEGCHVASVIEHIVHRIESAGLSPATSAAMAGVSAIGAPSRLL
jgi:uncharacterized protein